MPPYFSIFTARLDSGSPAMPVNFWPLMEIVTLFWVYAVLRTGIGLPTAARIICLVQPAQH